MHMYLNTRYLLCCLRTFMILKYCVKHKFHSMHVSQNLDLSLLFLVTESLSDGQMIFNIFYTFYHKISFLFICVDA